MDKTAAASAMEWSIKLEKSLRSRRPGKSLEALTEISKHIERWNRSLDLTFAEHKIYGLIPGEDKLFLNSIFLRLADVFRLGNKEIKNHVVKCFMKIRKSRKRTRVEDILSKSKLENYLELLRRVKEVFDNGDVEERAMALVLFGCWADFGCDSPDVRYILLSSLVSRDDAEVKAALFAAGCLCELTEDFSSVFLEMLSSMLLSTDTSKEVKLAGVRVFSKLSCSFPLADKAYKIGSKLLMNNPSEDEFSAAMLMSLSRIASRWTLLIPVQVELLSSFLSEDRSLHLQTTSLKSLRFLFSRGVCSYSSTTNVAHKLFTLLERPESQPLQVDALGALHKILSITPPTIPCSQISRLFKAVESMERLPNASSYTVMVARVLTDLCSKIFARADVKSERTGSALALQLVSFVFDRIFLLVTTNAEVSYDLSSELKVKALLGILRSTAEKHVHLVSLVLDQVFLFIDKLVKMLMDLENTKSSMDIKEESLISKVMFYVCKIMVACLRNFEGNDDEARNFSEGLRANAEKVRQLSSYFGSYTCMAYALLLHEVNITVLLANKDFALFHENLSDDRVLQSDKSALNSAKTLLLGERNHWFSYKMGISAMSTGAWSTAAFIFEQLTTVVESSSSVSCWLKSLAIFSSSEGKIQSLILSDRLRPVVNFKHTAHVSLKTKDGNFGAILLGARNGIISAEKILSSTDTHHMFRFQRWFLTVGIKALKAVYDAMNLLLTGNGGQQLERSVMHPCTKPWAHDSLAYYSSLNISWRIKNVARELDLLMMSFTGTDMQSIECLSSLALSFSLMAFTFGFAFSALELRNPEISRNPELESLREPSRLSLIEDLLGRLSCETQKRVVNLLKFFENPEGVSSPRFVEAHISRESRETRMLNELCEYAVGEIYRLHKFAISSTEKDGDSVSQIVNDDVSQLLSNVISKCVSIPFRTPNRFFRVRPGASAELFLTNEEGRPVDGSSISCGSHLSLTMCLRLKNFPLLGHGIKIHCVLHCEASPENGESKSQARAKEEDEEMNDVLCLNEKLLRHLSSSGTNRVRGGDGSTVNEYARFEVNEDGQGFCFSVLDVSSFPVGSYRIKWQSGFVDDSSGSYLSLFSLNAGPLFHIRNV